MVGVIFWLKNDDLYVKGIVFLFKNDEEESLLGGNRQVCPGLWRE